MSATTKVKAAIGAAILASFALLSTGCLKGAGAPTQAPPVVPQQQLQ